MSVLLPTPPDGTSFVETLVERRARHVLPPAPQAQAAELLDRVLALLFPHFARRVDATAAGVRADLERVQVTLEATLRAWHAPPSARSFLEALPVLHATLEEDAAAIFHGDPAARSLDEVIVAYPGFYAIAAYRLAHELHRRGVHTAPRLLTETAHGRTGIDIHPGATIGRRFSIDHGTGVVIGETAHVGDDVKIYQGVTLGAASVRREHGGQKRHPTLEDGVVVYAGATILGGRTVVGRGSVVAGNAFVTRSVPPGCLVGRHGELRPLTPDAPDTLDFVI